MIKITQLVRQVDRYCNFCNRLHDQDLRDVDIYSMRNDANVYGGIVVQLCEWCLRDLSKQLKDID
jgi:hypothetical protein